MQTGAVLHCLAVGLVPRLSRFGFLCDVRRSWVVVSLRNGFTQRVHTLCTSCLHHLHRCYVSPYSTPLSPADRLSVTPPRLLIGASSVSRYRTQSTYSGYTFIQSGSPRLDMQPK